MADAEEQRRMRPYVGLDVGTTTLSTVILDVERETLVARDTVPHALDVTPAPDRARGWAELDLAELGILIVERLAHVVAQVGDLHSEIAGIGVTGQMHGLALLGPGSEPLAPAITWQDRRTLECMPGADVSYLHRFIASAGGVAAFERTGCLPAAGYLGPTLFWLHAHNRLPTSGATACFVPDAAVAMLTGLPPCTDPTDGGSSGILDIVAREWDWAIIDRLGLPKGIWPPVREPGEVVGPIHPEIAAQTGLPVGTLVHVALGDNQASFVGSVQGDGDSVLINVGTGAQISGLMAGFQRVEGFDTRYYPGGRYLLVGAGLFGGRSYAYLRELFRRVGASFYGGRGDEELYDAMTQLAAQVPPGCDGLRCSPLFTGSRRDPSLRASYTGITPENLTPGHLARALLEGMAEVFYSMFAQARPVLGERTRLVGSGNGIRRNALLAEILSVRFGMPLKVPKIEEEAAVGAALMAAHGASPTCAPTTGPACGGSR